MNDRPVTGYLLKFIGGQYNGGDFPIDPDTEVIIGRHSDHDMVLVEDMVSRKHARITSYDGQLKIEDLGSTNGTFVNGEKLDAERVLAPNDRVLVGTNILKVHFLYGDEDGEGGPDVTGHHSTSPSDPSKEGKMTGAFSGMLEHMPLPDLLQVLSSSMKTGIVTLHHRTDVAHIYLTSGRVRFACINDDRSGSPLKAFYRLLGWEHGTFVFNLDEEEHEFDTEIEEPMSALMMEGMRILDEIRNIGDDVPEMSAKLRLVFPLESPLRELDGDQLDTLQLVLNNQSVSQALSKSEKGDIETMQKIVELIRKNYIVPS